MSKSDKRGQIAVIVNGYPRLYETDVAQEIFALEQRGISLEIWALHHPGEHLVNPIHKNITAPVFYVPQTLYKAPVRFLRALWWCRHQQGFSSLLRVFLRDIRRDFTIRRLRIFGQALIMARALPKTTKHIHACFLDIPATLAYYATLLTNRTWSFSAHDTDIRAIAEGEKQDKLALANWGIACSAQDVSDLRSLTLNPDKIVFMQQGIDVSVFSLPPQPRPARNGASINDPLRILSISRAHAQKGLDDLIRALAALPKNFHWQYVHIGGGKALTELKQLTKDYQLENRILFLGPREQTDILTLLREADLFILPTNTDRSDNRLPQVIMEAASQRLAIIATSLTSNLNFIRPNKEGILVPPSDWESLSNAINLLGRDPQQRKALGEAAYQRLQADFLQENHFDALINHFRSVIDSP